MTLRLCSGVAPRARRAAIALCAMAAVAGTALLADVPAAGAASPSCQTGGLVIWLDTQGDGTAGTIFYTLNFTNLSGHTCTLRGYPGVSAVNLGGHIVGSAASRLTGHPVRTITLRNGRTAAATLGAVDTGALPTCAMTTAAGLRVFPPNQTASRTIPFPFPACSNTGAAFLRVAPVS
jgi:hypothetical protein